VKHPGTYGIRPGERLSSVLQRAGGFQEGAYVRGAILERAQVRELQTKEQTQLMLRVKDLQNNVELLPEGDANQKRAKENALRQYQNALTQLGTNTPVGRVTMRISPEVSRWKNTSADLEVRAGDILVVPKQPSFVMVTGQVFNPTAVSYRPGKSAKWYLSQSGGPTAVANKKAIFVIRADGSVIGAKESLWSGPSLSAVLPTGRHGRGSRKGNRWRCSVADSVPGSASCIVCSEHAIYRVALLIGILDDSLVDRFRARI